MQSNISHLLVRKLSYKGRTCLAVTGNLIDHRARGDFTEILAPDSISSYRMMSLDWLLRRWTTLIASGSYRVSHFLSRRITAYQKFADTAKANGGSYFMASQNKDFDGNTLEPVWMDPNFGG